MGAMRSTVVKLTAITPEAATLGPWRAPLYSSTAGLCLPGQRVGSFDHLRQAVLGDMGVDLRRCDIGMAEHGLHAAQVRTALDEMRRKGMAKVMRRQLVRIEFGADRELLQHLMTAPSRDVSLRSARGKEKSLGMRTAHAGGQKVVPHFKIFRDGLARGLI